jgi:hypothetical protein
MNKHITPTHRSLVRLRSKEPVFREENGVTYADLGSADGMGELIEAGALIAGVFPIGTRNIFRVAVFTNGLAAYAHDREIEELEWHEREELYAQQCLKEDGGAA